MKMTLGLFGHMVVQRNACDVSAAAFAGECRGAGRVTATVSRSGRRLGGWQRRRVGIARGGRFLGCLRGLPAGGPYDVELRIEDGRGAAREALTVPNVLVGDVWLLGGQSNMEGIGLLKHALKPHPLVRAFYMDDRWEPARDPIHNLDQAKDAVHTDLNGGIPVSRDVLVGVGPGVAFGQRMRELSGVPQGLIACAHGGTSMTQWDPKLRVRGSGSLYGAMLRRLRKNGGRVAGLVWYQGCSDANAEAAPRYTQRMRAFVQAVRRDCAAPRLPVVLVQIARVIGWGPDAVAPWNSIQEQQRRLPGSVAHLAVVPAIDLALDDLIHISGRSQHRLGRRLAYAMHVLREGSKAGRPPIRMRKVTIVPDRACASVVAEFEHVVGRLHSGGCRPAGFTLGGAVGDCVLDTELDGNRAIIRTVLTPDAVADLFLHYGCGTNPYCNITDEGDRSLPVFGPLPLGKPRALTDYVRRARVSPLLPSAGKLEGLAYPPSLDALRLEERSFSSGFCDRHLEIGPRAPQDELMYYACRIDCPEAMRLAVWLGYDGPVKVWIDGDQVYHDPEGTNPANPADARIPWQAAPGQHTVLVALGTNGGRAWGIFLRLERLDVALHARLQGPGYYTLPAVLG